MLKIKLSFLTICAFLLPSCSLDANIIDLHQKILTKGKNQHSGSDYIHGETVITSSNVTIQGRFGEISEQQVLSNGVEIKGGFYE